MTKNTTNGARLWLPFTHRRFVRTTSLLKWLFVKERQRPKIIPNGFGEKRVLERPHSPTRAQVAIRAAKAQMAQRENLPDVYRIRVAPIISVLQRLRV